MRLLFFGRCLLLLRLHGRRLLRARRNAAGRTALRHGRRGGSRRGLVLLVVVFLVVHRLELERHTLLQMAKEARAPTRTLCRGCILDRCRLSWKFLRVVLETLARREERRGVRDERGISEHILGFRRRVGQTLRPRAQQRHRRLLALLDACAELAAKVHRGKRAGRRHRRLGSWRCANVDVAGVCERGALPCRPGRLCGERGDVLEAHRAVLIFLDHERRGHANAELARRIRELHADNVVVLELHRTLVCVEHLAVQEQRVGAALGRDPQLRFVCVSRESARLPVCV